jgi:hypothetical protein
MPKFLSLFLFPDINVWLALSYERHIHYPIARRWFEDLGENARVCFCRFTQIGLLRLLTTPALMREDALSQVQAWRVYDRWLEDDRVLFIEEPTAIEGSFRLRSQRTSPAPKDWGDAYSAAFAEIAGFRLVTFDQALRANSKNSIIPGLDRD